MSLATLAVDMWLRIGPPRLAQAWAMARSDWTQTRSSQVEAGPDLVGEQKRAGLEEDVDARAPGPPGLMNSEPILRLGRWPGAGPGRG